MKDEPASRARGEFSGWAIALLVGVTLVVYWPVMSGEFIDWDDPMTLRDNPRMNPPTLRSVSYYWTHADRGLYVPVTYTAWLGLATIARVAVGYGSFTLNPWVFHSTSVVVHVCAVLAVYSLLRRLTPGGVAALVGAALFAVHPLQLESVAWASGLKDVLAGCFAVIAIWRYVIHVQRETPSNPWRPDILGTLSFVLAMLAKPSAAMVPLIALGIDWLLIGRPIARAIKSVAIWTILAIPVLIVARIAQDVAIVIPAPLRYRPLIAADSLAFYLYKLVLPLELAMDYGRKPDVIIASGAIAWTWIAPAALLAIVILVRRRARWLAGAAWVLMAALLPILGLATFQFQFTSTVADHYMYLAMLGSAIGVAHLLRASKPLALGIAGAVLLALAIRTATLAPIWRDNQSLFTHILEVNPRSFVALNNLGNAAMVAGDNPTALAYFRRAMQVSRDYPTSYENAARVLAAMGDLDGSIAAIEQSIEIRAALPPHMYPNYMEDHYRVAQVLVSRHRYSEAKAHLQALLQLKPDHAAAKELLAHVESQPQGSN